MEWQPIETYDALETKPKYAVFRFEGTPPLRGSESKYGLQPTIEFARNFGSRVCTHWMPLPDPPKC